MNLFFIHLFICSTENRTQGLTFVRQVLYNWVTTPAWDESLVSLLCLACRRCPLDVDSLALRERPFVEQLYFQNKIVWQRLYFGLWMYLTWRLPRTQELSRAEQCPVCAQCPHWPLWKVIKCHKGGAVLGLPSDSCCYTQGLWFHCVRSRSSTEKLFDSMLTWSFRSRPSGAL